MEGAISPNTRGVSSRTLFLSFRGLSILAAAYLISASLQKHSLPVSLPPLLCSLLLSRIVPTVPEVALHLFVETGLYPFSLLSPTEVIWEPSGAQGQL